MTVLFYSFNNFVFCFCWSYILLTYLLTKKKKEKNDDGRN